MRPRPPQVSAALQSLHEAYDRLPERDQRTLRLGGAVVSVILIMGGVITVNEKASAAEGRFADRQTQMAELPMQLAELRRALRLGATAELPLLTLARQAGELTGLTPEVGAGADGSATLQLAGVPFDSVLELIANLEAAKVDIRRLRINATDAGRVNASLELAPRRS